MANKAKKEYRFSVLEQWMRRGIVEATSRKEATRKILREAQDILWRDPEFLRNMEELPDYIEFEEEGEKNEV